MHKIIWASAISIILILYVPAEPFHDVFNNVLHYFNITKKCYKNSNFEEIFQQEGLNYKALDREVTDDGLEKLLGNFDDLNKLKIPAITHHIYFSFSTNLVQPSEYNLEMLSNSFAKLSSLELPWKHYIWTNGFDVKLKNVEVKNIDEFKEHPLYPYLVQAIDLNKVSHFSEASDLLRFMILEKYGGIYMDMDYEIYDSSLLPKLMKKFDFIGGRESIEGYSFYGSAFIAAKPDHLVVKEMVSMALRNKKLENVPDYIKYPCSKGYQIIFNAAPLVTISYFHKNNQDGNIDIILPSWMIYNYKFARFKNKNCYYDDMTQEEFKARNNDLNNLMKEYSNSIKYSNDGSIYYSLKDRNKFSMIGADMFCGSWSKFHKRIYYPNS